MDHDFVEYELNAQIDNRAIDTTARYCADSCAPQRKARSAEPVVAAPTYVAPPQLRQLIQSSVNGGALVESFNGQPPGQQMVPQPAQQFGPPQQACFNLWGASSTDSVIIIMLVVIACLLMYVRCQLNQMISYSRIDGIIKSNIAASTLSAAPPG